MTGAEFKAKCSTGIVYIWKRGDEWLYVGSSSHGLRRLLTNHPALEDLQDTDTVEIIEVADKWERLKMERRLIQEHNPRFNGKQGPKGPWKYKLNS